MKSLALVLLVLAPAAGPKEDAAFALERLEAKAGALFRTKGIDWKKAGYEITKAAAAAKTPEDHYAVLVRLTARRTAEYSYYSRRPELTLAQGVDLVKKSPRHDATATATALDFPLRRL